MKDIDVATFRKAIHATHGVDSQFLARIDVREQLQGEPVWEGEVLVFELFDHPEAKKCNAWEVDGQVTAVLEVPPVRSAVDAGRASFGGD